MDPSTVRNVYHAANSGKRVEQPGFRRIQSAGHRVHMGPHVFTQNATQRPFVEEIRPLKGPRGRSASLGVGRAAEMVYVGSNLLGPR
jgi:hypothetical protein